jgi:hypothetical protein
MPSHYGQKSTLTALDKDLHINIEDQVMKYPDEKIPLIKRLSGKNFKNEIRSHKYEWSNRENRPVKANVLNGVVASDATEMIVDTAGVFNKDDVFQKPDGEQCIVTAVTGGTNITFKHWAGSAEALAINDEVVVIGVAAPQGADADDMVITGFDDLYNYTQIFEDVVDLSGTQHASLIRGDENSADLISRKQKELVEKLQSTLILGQRAKDDATKTYTMGGLKYLIDTYAEDNVVDFGGSSTWDTDASVISAFDDAFDLISNKVEGKPVIYLGAAAMRELKNVQDDTTRTTLREKSRGIGVVDTYLSHLFGEVDIVLLQERSGILNDLIFIGDESSYGYKAHRKRGWYTTPLAKTGDSYRWQVLGEYTAKLDTPKSWAYIYNLGL